MIDEDKEIYLKGERLKPNKGERIVIRWNTEIPNGFQLNPFL
jgi:hypothetical protein